MMGAIPAPLLTPALVVLAGIVVALLADAFARRGLAVAVLAVATLAAGAAGAALLLGYDTEVSQQFVVRGGFGSLGSLGYLLAGAALAAGHRRLSASDHGVAAGSLVAIGTVFSAALLAAADLAVFFVSLAGLGVVGYALVAAAGTRPAEESAVRYFVQGAVASGLTVYGLALLVGMAETEVPLLSQLALPDLAWARPAALAAMLLVAALAFKVGAFPFHSWVPDAYQHADPPVVAYLSAVPKMAAVVALLGIARAVLNAGVSADAVGIALQALAVGSLVFGAFGMLRQRSLARLLGYSAIAQVGYALLAMAAGADGAAVGVFIATYAVAACAAFVGAEAIQRALPEWEGDLEGLAGLSRRAPATAASMVVVLLSLTGIPLFAGFWGKFAVFAAGIDAGLLWLVVLAGVCAVVSFGGYGSVIRWMYFHNDQADTVSAPAMPAGMARVVLVLLAAAIVLIGLLPLVIGLEPISRVVGL